VRREIVRTAREAERLGFAGSPTILVDGIDPFADPGASTGLACRIEVVPSVDEIERAIAEV
jgi:hypothetical protein